MSGVTEVSRAIPRRFVALRRPGFNPKAHKSPDYLRGPKSDLRRR
jgi:hypothetical protein